MGKALYRKYRSKKLSEIVGQEHVTTALDNALKNGRVAHAYLFTGPRGVGKTSIARILAHEVNNLPYEEEATHLDIIEIDAASNRRIDEIRTLRERVNNAPTSAKYKVYIIDEVHMLTREAFNALLKTLEEPPEHVIFILATTEAHKLPETIVSRTQRYTFKPAKIEDTITHLQNIADQEKIKIDLEALKLLAQHGNGSFRDSISLLDQVSNTSDNVTVDDVHRSLGIAPYAAVQELIDTVSKDSTSDVITSLTNLREQGYQAPQVAKQISQQLRQRLLANDETINLKDSTTLLQKLIEVPTAHDPQALLEIILLEPVLARNKTTTLNTKPSKNEKPKKPEPIQDIKEPEPVSEIEELPIKKISEITVLDENSWQRVLHALKQKHNTLYGVARMAVPVFNNDSLTLIFSFPFHKKRMEETKNQQKLNDVISQELGKNLIIHCIVEKNSDLTPNPSSENPSKSTNNAVDAISNIFGGAEVLE